MNLSKPLEPRPIQSLPRLAGLALLVATVAGTIACNAPGMKLSVKPSHSPADSEMPKVNLRTISPELLKNLPPRNLEPLPVELLAAKHTPYQLGPQDVLLVTVWDHPEISMPLGQYRSDAATGMVIDDSGEIFFPYVGSLKVAGLTIQDVRKLLTQRLASYVRNPQVDVKVVGFRSKKVYIGGEVKTPSVCEITETPLSLSEVIHRSGGFLPSADDSCLRLTRGAKTWTLDYQAFLASGSGLRQLLLQDGDTLFVPNAQEQPIYMMGEFQRPGLTTRTHGRLSLARAITEVGGISGTSADARSIYVLRQGHKVGEVEVFHMDARNPTAMVLADQFPLQARDVVYVDAGTLVRFSRVMSLLIPTVAAVNGTAMTGVEYRYLWNRGQ